MDFKSKFKIGDVLYTIENMRIISFVVEYVSVYSRRDYTGVSYGDERCMTYAEKECFDSREKLHAFIEGKDV